MSTPPNCATVLHNPLLFSYQVLDIAPQAFSKIPFFASPCFESGVTAATDRRIGNSVLDLRHLSSK